MSDEREQEAADRGFRVEDRRRFHPDGTPREEGAAPEAATETPPPADPEPSAAEAGAAGSVAAGPAAELTFATFLISLGTQALVHLGDLPDPVSHQVQADLGAAREMIDILGLLQEKTRGNLDEAESQLLNGLLYDLRLRFVERRRPTS